MGTITDDLDELFEDDEDEQCYVCGEMLYDDDELERGTCYDCHMDEFIDDEDDDWE